MNKYIINFLLLMLLFSSCSEEKDYYFGNIQNRNVNFTATNLTVRQDSIDSACSIKYNEYYYGFNNWILREPEVSFSLNVYNSDYNDQYRTVTIRLHRINQLWIGGNNTVQVVFKPSCEEEKSAQFTFPDGTSAILTKENPIYDWHISEENATKLTPIASDWYYATTFSIYSISEYTRNGIKYVNSGFVLLEISEYSIPDGGPYYDSANDRWIDKHWINAD